MVKRKMKTKEILFKGEPFTVLPHAGQEGNLFYFCIFEIILKIKMSGCDELTNYH